MELSITPRLLIAAAEKRGWKTRIIDSKIGLIYLELPDGRHYYLRGISSILTSAVNVYIGDQKHILSALVQELGIVVPPSIRCHEFCADVVGFLEQYGTVVVKPINASHGNGVSVGITTPAQLKSAIQYAHQFSKSILIQQHITGDDYRVLLMGGELAAAAIREPAFVVGDGKHTIAELIQLENNGPNRGEGYGSIATQIDVEAAQRYVGQEKLQNIPAPGQKTRVVGTANIGKGGVAIDVTDTIAPGMVATARRIVEHFGIKLCGVDFIVDSNGTPYLIEINSAPSLGLHEYPYEGKPRHTADRFLDVLTAK